MQKSAIVRNLGGIKSLDRIGSPIQSVVDGALAKMPVVRKALQGTSWLGHALHPATVAFPIGAWAAGFVLDMIEVSGNRRHRQAADIVHLFGLCSACAAGITGLAEYVEAKSPQARRVGVVHGLLNVGILGLYGASLLARRRGRRTQGIALSGVGLGLLLVSGWLGGELTYALGLGQTKDRMAAPELPSPGIRVEEELEVVSAPEEIAGEGPPVTH